MMETSKLFHLKSFARLAILCFLMANMMPLLAQTSAIIKTLQHENIKRTYHIHLPIKFNKDTKSPLVLALHGGGGRGSHFNTMTTQGSLLKAARQDGVILVFPEGVDRKWNDGREVFNNARPHDDVGFISRIIDLMIKDYGADPKRVYATGISNGGFMSIRLAMDITDKITAIAPVTAQLSKSLETKKPSQPISIMIINGTSDPLVPFGGGHIRLGKFGRSRGEILSTRATIELFRQFNECSQAPETLKLPDKDPDDKTHVTMTSYRGGKQNTEVILVKVIGGGHTWPGGKQYFPKSMIGVVSRDIDASKLILDFFLRHSR